MKTLVATILMVIVGALPGRIEHDSSREPSQIL
jgi:hypothetical protein